MPKFCEGCDHGVVGGNLCDMCGGTGYQRKNPHAVALGRKGGAATKGITSEAKKSASRANVAKARAAKESKKSST